MPTKLITSLDQLEPGMKTLDGWIYRREIEPNSHFVQYDHGPLGKATHYVSTFLVCEYFLNKKVEVPE